VRFGGVEVILTTSELHALSVVHGNEEPQKRDRKKAQRGPQKSEKKIATSYNVTFFSVPFCGPLCAFLWLIVREYLVWFETHLAEAFAGLVDHFARAANQRDWRAESRQDVIQ